jgi:hypothetical protein
MQHPIIRCAVRTAHTITTLLREALARLAEEIRRLWAGHRDRLAGDSGYAAAVGSLAATAAQQSRLVDLAAALIVGLLAVYAATRPNLGDRHPAAGSYLD